MANSLSFLSAFASSVTFDENTVNATPQLIDTDVAFDDADNNFDTGTLQLSGLLAEDIVSILDVGTAMGEIGFDGSIVTYEGTAIGTATGGSGGTPLVVTFNASATAGSIDALIQNLTYANLSDSPTASRTLELTITDAAGDLARPTVTFASATNPLAGSTVVSQSTPTLADLDGDGDLDVLLGAQNGQLSYFENTGSSISPSYIARTGGANPFNLIDAGLNSTPSFVDLDGDGDLDAVSGEFFGAIRYYENTGDLIAPVFVVHTGASNPFNSINVGYSSAPTFADIDGDGDFDAVVGTDDGNIAYFENTGDSSTASFVAVTGASNPFNSFDVGFQSIPTFGDFDSDGDLDMIAGEFDGTLNYFENTGTTIAPSFVARVGAINPVSGIDVGGRSSPTLGDLDGDGDLDLVVGENAGVLIFYENTTAADPVPGFSEATGTANPFDGISVGTHSKPSFADLDGDGDLDVVIGDYDGFVNYFENTGSSVAPSYVARTGGANPFDSIDVGFLSTPSLADLDGDGDLDAVIGVNVGTLDYYENTGSAVAPSYIERTGAANPFDGILDPFGRSAPSFADLDGDGDLDAVIGGHNGNLRYFENTGSAVAPSYSEQTGAANPFNGFNNGLYSAPAFADIDGDGDLDAVIGELFSVLNYYENTGSAVMPSFVARTGAGNPFDGIAVNFDSAPSFADLDGDGDPDLVIGQQTGGGLSYYENTGSGFSFVLNVTPQNDAPTLTATGLDPTFIAGGAGQVLFSAVTADPIEAMGGFKSVTFTVAGLADGGNEILTFEGTDIALTNGNMGTIGSPFLSYTVSVAGSTATVVVGFAPGPMQPVFSTSGFQTDLLGVTYRNTAVTPTVGDRVITITSVTDSGGTDNGGVETTAVNIVSTVSMNVAPPSAVVVNPLAASLAENTNIGMGVKVGDIVVTDADGAGTNTLTLSGADVADFAIRNGDELFYIGASPDFETKASYDVTVEVDDADLGVVPDAMTDFTLAIGNLSPEYIFGTAGADFLFGGTDRDIMFGFGGNDLMQGGTGNDVMRGHAGIDRMFGDNGADSMFGGNQNDVMRGGNQNDFLFGENNNDRMFGDGGNDVMTGGRGRDIMNGGAGRDRFDYNNINESRGALRDRIDGFRHNQDDIDLRTIDANTTVGGNQRFKFIGDDSFNRVAGELHIRTAGSTTKVEGDINGDGRADFVIDVTGGVTLTAGDFFL